MSQPLIMSFRPDAAEMCLGIHPDGLVKTQTRRIANVGWGGCYSFGGLVAILNKDCRPVWEVGKSIAIKPKRHLCAMGRVMCTGLKVEHVQGITEEDAIREGVAAAGNHDYSGDGFWVAPEFTTFKKTAREAFELVWNNLYPKGPKSWEANPLVVAIEFRPLEEGEV